MKNKLQKIGLNPNNSIVIGSGILQAMNIRKSHDIDLVVSTEMFDILRKSEKFEYSTKHETETLKDNIFDIHKYWKVLGKTYSLNDFVENSIIIGGVRYTSLDFIYRAKKSWIEAKTARPKDIEDIKLINMYLKNKVK